VEIAAHNAKFAAPFADARRLWLDALSALYDERLGEAVVFAVAFIEVAWNIAAKASTEKSKALVGQLPQSSQRAAAERVLDSYLEATTDNAWIPKRFTHHSKAIFNFSFSEDWDAANGHAKWKKFEHLLEVRNKVAHGTFVPEIAKAHACIRTAWDTFMELERLVRAL
jgi:hypothetical protein